MIGLPSTKRPCTPPRDTPAGTIGVFERDGVQVDMLWSARNRVWCFAKVDDETPMALARRVAVLGFWGYNWPKPAELKLAGWRLVELRSGG